SVKEVAHSDRWAIRLLTRLPQALVVVDRQLRVVFVNPASRRLLRQPLRVGDPLPEPWPVFPLREHARSLFGRRPAVARQVFEAAGRIVSVQGLTSSDQLTATLMIADVTQDERMRRAEREFVENAAHELRTPIAAILSAAEALESGAKDEPADRDQFLRHIRLQADRLARLAASLLLLRRVGSRLEGPPPHVRAANGPP